MGTGRSGIYFHTKGVKDGKEHSLKINAGKQGKHIPGTNNYIEGRSIFLGTVKDAEKLIKRHGGAGQMLSNNRERVDFGKIIGYYVDPVTSEKKATTIGIIHYSKDGTHIVPARPKY